MLIGNFALMNANSITDRQRLNFALLFTMAFLISIWGVHLINYQFELGLQAHGNHPGRISGLKGIFTSPFLHGDWTHLWNNTASFFTLNGLLFYFYRSIAVRVWGILLLASGIGLWIIGEVGTNHIGASGIVYGLAAFLFFSGVIRKNLLLLRISLVVVFLYGGMVWWMLPIKDGISWEGHTAGAIAGVALAVLYRKSGPKNPIYKYEISEAAHEDLPEWWMRGNPKHPDTLAHKREELEKESSRQEYTFDYVEKKKKAKP
jgi:membrane associated rhomboid family serine protease